MLTMIRQMLRSKAAGGLFVLLIVAMAAWGVTDVFSGGLGANLLGAGDRTVSDRAFDNAVERELRSATDSRGRSLTKEQALGQGLIDQILQREQFGLVIKAYADTQGLAPTQAAIRAEIEQNESFQDTTGLFDLALYNSLLRQNGYTSADFESMLESSLTQDRLRRLTRASLAVPVPLAQIEAAFRAEQRDAEWFVFEARPEADVGSPDETEIIELYQEVEASLQEPERRRVSLLKMSPEDFTGSAGLTEEDLVAFYDAYRSDRYTGPDTRSFTVYQFTTEDAARAALGRIAGGAEAAVLENLSSTTVLTGARDLIRNTRLQDLVFGAGSSVNGIYGPQLEGDLWTVIRLETIFPGESTPFEQVRDEIEEELAFEQATELFYAALPRFDDLIGTGASLEAIGQDLGLPVLSFDAVDAMGALKGGLYNSSLRENPELLSQIFDRTEGAVTERLGEDEASWMARVDEIQPSRRPSLDEVREDLVEAWKIRKRNALREEETEAIISRLDSGESTLAQEAENYGTTVQSLSRPRSRSTIEAELPPALISRLFSAREVGDVQAVTSTTGATLILKVTLIDPVSPEALPPMARQIAPSLDEGLANDLFQAFFLDVQAEIDVDVNDRALDTYKRSIQVTE
ncbi:MAG: SurA N-terminal domain-containing protein [Henriciella sp.]